MYLNGAKTPFTLGLHLYFASQLKRGSGDFNKYDPTGGAPGCCGVDPISDQFDH